MKARSSNRCLDDKAAITATGHHAGSKCREGEVAHLPRDGGGGSVDDRLRSGAVRDRLQEAVANKSEEDAVAKMARQMLADQKNGYGSGSRSGRKGARAAVRPRRDATKASTPGWSPTLRPAKEPRS